MPLVCLSGLGEGGVGGNTLQRRFQIKASSSFRLSFLYLFLCQKLYGAAWDHSELASICHDMSWDTRLACPQQTYQPPPNLPLLPSSPITLRFSLCTAKLPISTCMITEHSDLYSGESSSTSFGRHEASAPAAFMQHYKTGMKSEWSCCFSALNFLQ